MGATSGDDMIDFFGEVATWLSDPANWTGRGGLPNRLWEHIVVSGASLLIAGAIALPAGVMLGHRGEGGMLAVSAVNLGRAVPSFGIVGLAFPVTLALGLSPLGFWATLVALVVLALPPMFVNAHAAVRQTEPALVEAARGMGMTERQVLRGVEVPLAAPVIMAGVRTAAVEVIATATLGAVVGYGGLGRFIIDGFAQRKYEEVFIGGVTVALLAVITETTLRWVQRRLDHTHPARRRRRPEALDPADVIDAVPVG
jgi:osmoprotectant transport system permease protein